MIRVRDLVPDVYYDESRDFQTVGRSFEALFNYLKTEADLVKENPLSQVSDEKLLRLLAKTVGFDQRHDLSSSDLRALCSSFADILRKKGSLAGIEEAAFLFVRCRNIRERPEVVKNGYDVDIYLPEGAYDTSLLDDVLEYVLPCGTAYRIVYMEKGGRLSSEVGSSDAVGHAVYGNGSLSAIAIPGENDVLPRGVDSSQWPEDVGSVPFGSVYMPENGGNRGGA